MQHKIWSMIFVLTLAVKDTSIGRIFIEKKNMGVRDYFLKKRTLYMQSLMKEQKQPQVVILQKSIFYNYLFGACGQESLEDPIKVFSLWIFLHIYFFMTLIMVTGQLYWRKVLCDCFHFIWLWLFIAIIKRSTERCAQQLYRSSLSFVNFPENELHQIVSDLQVWWWSWLLWLEECWDMAIIYQGRTKTTGASNIFIQGCFTKQNQV